MKKKFNFLALLFSLLGSALGFCSGALPDMLLRKLCSDSFVPIIIIIVSGFSLAMAVLLGFLGLRLGLVTAKKSYRAENAKVVALVLAVLLVFVLGSVSQWVYALQMRTYSENVVVNGTMDGMNVVLLLDASGSMDDFEAVCKEAACNFVDTLNQNCNLQFMGFSDFVWAENKTDFLPMTDANKKIVKDVITNCKDGGGTDFDGVLVKAVDTLTSNTAADRKNVIIMITDGTDMVEDPYVIQPLQNDEISLFTIRITIDDPELASMIQGLIDLADKDFVIDPADAASLNLTALSDALNEILAITGTQEQQYTKLELTDEALWQKHPFDAVRFLVELVMCTVLSLLFSLAYCGKIRFLDGLLSGVIGLVCGLLVSFLPAVGLIAVWVGCGSAFVTLAEADKNV